MYDQLCSQAESEFGSAVPGAAHKELLRKVMKRGRQAKLGKYKDEEDYEGKEHRAREDVEAGEK